MNYNTHSHTDTHTHTQIYIHSVVFKLSHAVILASLYYKILWWLCGGNIHFAYIFHVLVELVVWIMYLILCFCFKSCQKYAVMSSLENQCWQLLKCCNCWHVRSSFSELLTHSFHITEKQCAGAFSEIVIIQIKYNMIFKFSELN